MRALLCAAVLAWPGLAAAAVLELHEQVLVSQPRVRLADLADIAGEDAGRLRQLDLGAAPRIGYVQRWTRNALAEMIRRRAGAAVEWRGAQQVQLRTAARLVDADAMLALAMQVMDEAYGAAGALQLAPQARPVEVEAPRDAQLVARPLAGRQLAPRMEVWLDLVWQGTVYRSMRVPLSVQAPRELLVARRDLAAGETVQAADFVRQTADAALLGGPAAQALPASWRMRQALRAGQALAASQLLAPHAVRRGEQVQVLWQEGVLRIERAGTALADAAPGERLAVRMAGGAEFSGRVELDGTVRVDRN
ncbi:flagella basal body P-ring formation protein FlgA [Duganella sp. CF458]|uniref:flagellar basal body P-ring formation chaperone FlgA n=1 Tax=Duganella sp. CF458 TaxID=1884368 RepID=UPI0008F2BE19|nr:flagellar basal body P-ring formation chaperone FlgA [Duganella sp. CF458]SFG88483.1 flagella basal body P-ring formation protein FlgA [Duganella sp. CF458]